MMENMREAFSVNRGEFPGGLDSFETHDLTKCDYQCSVIIVVVLSL